MKRLEEVIQDKAGNYILPLFWMHGEDENTLRTYVDKIDQAGIQAFCIESRPHPDFAGGQWWHDMDIILDQAKKHDMQMWLLDDSHFPTGYANGKIKSEHPELKKKYLKIAQLDFVGPLKDATLIVKWGSPSVAFLLNEEAKLPKDKILKTIAAKKTGDSQVDADTFIDLSAHVHDGLLHWDIPEGEWRIFTLIQTIAGGESQTEDYLNPLDKAATQVLIQEVYQSHYDHYKNEFGKTFQGFFSDEPRLGNIHGAFASIGRVDMVLPWREGMLEEFFKEDYKNLPLLSTVTANGREKAIRLKYMNIVSTEYAKNFTQVLADWSHAHGVQYIGHIIEDNNAHARLGYGDAHYFRAIGPMDMAGIDVVLNQIMPGMDRTIFKSMTKQGWDGEFFHYGLAKMGASLGHLDHKKHGRVMSEVFGAYGWAEGLNLMKFLADHMLVRGVNYFSPHAFDPNVFPDPDCPPHFYAHGHDPEYRYMSILMNYMNRMSHLLSGGQHSAQVAILYHAEAEWMGDYMLFQKPARVLMQNQIDFDIVPIDYVMNAQVDRDSFTINQQTFTTLVIPYAEALPHKFLARLENLAERGITVLFIDKKPKTDENSQSVDSFVQKIGRVTALEELPNRLAKETRECFTDHKVNYLRYYHYQQGANEVYMFFNEDPYKAITTSVKLKNNQQLIEYNGLENQIFHLDYHQHGNYSEFILNLQPNESTIIISEQQPERTLQKQVLKLPDQRTQVVDTHYSLSFATSEDYPNFRDPIVLRKLKGVNRIKGKECFAGNISYHFEIPIEPFHDKDRIVLELGTVNEIADLSINGKNVGTKITAPYAFDITDFIHVGKNQVEVIVVNHLGIQQQDYLSQYIPIKPAGLLGPIQLKLK